MSDHKSADEAWEFWSLTHGPSHLRAACEATAREIALEVVREAMMLPKRDREDIGLPEASTADLDMRDRWLAEEGMEASTADLDMKDRILTPASKGDCIHGVWVGNVCARCVEVIEVYQPIDAEGGIMTKMVLLSDNEKQIDSYTASIRVLKGMLQAERERAARAEGNARRWASMLDALRTTPTEEAFEKAFEASCLNWGCIKNAPNGVKLRRALQAALPHLHPRGRELSEQEFQRATEEVYGSPFGGMGYYDLRAFLAEIGITIQAKEGKP